MTNFKVFAFFILAASIASALTAESRCPGNVAGLPFHLVNRYQIILPVSLNHSGPYNFLLDTGTQITMVDPSLAAELHLNRQGSAVIASLGVHGSASFAQLDQLEVGSHSVINQKVLVYDLRNLPVSGLNIQGILGEDFLGQFDMLVDNAHTRLCLDDSNAMRGDMKGSHIALVDPGSTKDGASPNSLIVVAKLSDGMRPVRLKLDSGSNAAILYSTCDCMAMGPLTDASLHGGGLIGAQLAFTSLPPQNLKMGAVEVSNVPFITLAGVQKDSDTSDFDGLLTMGLFKRVFIDPANHFAVFQPW